MSWDAYAQRARTGCKVGVKLIGAGVLGKDGTKWASDGDTDFSSFGAQLAAGGATACKNNFLGTDNNMMKLGEAEGCETYKKAQKACAIRKTKQAVAYAVVEGTPQDAVLACNAIADALIAVGF